MLIELVIEILIEIVTEILIEIVIEPVIEVMIELVIAMEPIIEVLLEVLTEIVIVGSISCPRNKTTGTRASADVDSYYKFIDLLDWIQIIHLLIGLNYRIRAYTVVCYIIVLLVRVKL